MPAFRHLPRLAGALAALLGIVTIIGWHEHWTLAVQMLSISKPMQYNSAWCFLLCGVGLFLLTTRQQRFTPWLGGLVGIFALLTLLEYVTGRNFGIDQLVIKKPFIVMVMQYPGRMSPLTGICFLLVALALILPASRWRRLGLTAVGLLSCVVVMVAVIALGGYLLGIEMAIGWGAYTRMAFQTALEFILLGSGLFVWGWQRSRAVQFNFLQWVPTTAALTLMAMIISISIISFNQLKTSTDWRKHSYEVLNTAQMFLGDVFATQRGMRGYALTGQSVPLQVYEEGLRNVTQHLAELKKLTADNPDQQARAKNLAPDLAGLLAYSQHLVNIRKTQGLEAAVQLEITGEGFARIKTLLADLDTFNSAERQLLDERSATVEADFHNTARLLVFGSTLAGGLLVLANFMAGREVRRRRLTEASLRTSEERFRLIVEGVKDYAILQLDPAGRVSSWNSGAQKIKGYTAEEIIGQHFTKFYPPEALAIDKPARELAEALANGQVRDEGWRVRKDGSQFYANVLITAIYDSQGKHRGFAKVTRDITESRRAEEALRTSEERLRLMNRELEHQVAERTAQLESANLSLQSSVTELKKSGDELRQQAALFDQTYDGVIVWNWNGPITFWNQGAENLYGFSRAEALNQSSHTLLQTRFPDSLEQLLQALEHNKQWEGELEHTTRDGHKITVDSRMTLIRELDRDYVLEINRDITKRKQLERDMRESEERFRTMANSMPQLAWIAKADGFITWYNRRWYEYTGTTPEQMEGWGWQRVHDPKVLPEVMEKWTGSIHSGKPFEMEFPLLGADGQFRIFLTRVEPLKDAEGRVMQWFGTNTDVDELKRSEEKVKTLNSELEQRVIARTAELISSNETLRESEERIRLAAEAAGVAVWAWDIQSGTIHWDEKMFEIYGIPRKPDGLVVYEDWRGRVLPGDLAAQEQKLQHTVATGGRSQREFRITRAADQSLRFIQAAEMAVPGADGQTVRVIGINLDITERKQAEENLRLSEERFRSAFDDAPIGMSLVNPQGRWLKVNRSLCEMLGYTEAELLETDFQHVTHPEDLEKDLDNVRQVLAGNLLTYQMEKRYLHKQGAVIPVMLSVSLVRDREGAPLYFVAQIENITERKRAAELIAANEELLRQFIKHTPAAVAMLDTQMRYVQASERWIQDYQLAGRDLIGKSHYEIFPDVPQRWKDIHQRVLAGAVEKCDEDPFPRADGTTEWLQWEARPWRQAGGEIGGLIFFTQVITARKQAEQKIAESLQEKEALLREIHHRVKNNMQVISSILQLQTGYIKDPAALEVFKDCQGRIRTMALIHEKLYRSEGLAQIDFKDYLESLIGLLLRSQLSKGIAVRHEFQIEQITLDVDTAIPLGLIANELVSNCLKHAFTGRTKGFVRVLLRQQDGGGFQLVVQDDGKGLPTGFDPETSNSLGVRLVKILSSQIKGKMEFKSDGGTEFIITFGNNPNPSKT